MKNQMLELINGALRNDDNVSRHKAESRLVQLRNADTAQFFLTCAEILRGEENQDFFRQSAATIISMSTLLKSPLQGNPFYWDLVPSPVKETVKDIILGALINPKHAVMKGGANCISSIAVIEVPRNQWLNLIDILAENTSHQDMAVRNASITTIGFICEKFHRWQVKVNQHTCQQFLGGIILGTRQNHSDQIVQTSLKALGDSLFFLQSILQETKVRNQIFNIICIHMKNPDQVHIVYQICYEFVKICNNYLGSYLGNMLSFIIDHIQQRNQNTILALELLDTIGSEYLERKDENVSRLTKTQAHNYLLGFQANLVPEIMRCLLIQKQDQIDNVEMRNSAVKTLGTIVASGNKDSIDIIINGVATVVKSENIWQQQASAPLLSTLCQFEDRDYAQKYIMEAFIHVIGLLASKQKIVIVNTLTGLVAIAESFPHHFYDHKNIRDIVNKLFELYEWNCPIIKTLILNLIKNMTQQIESSNALIISDPSIILTKIVSEYEKIIDNFYGDNKEYAEKASLIIMNCIYKINDTIVIKHMVEFLHNKYMFYIDANIADKEIIITSILSILHTCIMALQSQPIDSIFLQKLYSIIEMQIKHFGIEEQGLNLMGGIATAWKEALERRLDYYWKNIIMHGISMEDNPKTFKAALNCTGDFSRIFGPASRMYSHQVLQKLLKVIHENKYDRSIKLNIMNCIADIALGLGASIEPYIEDILKICDLCFGAVYQLSNIPSEREYVEELKTKIIDMYACLTFATQSQKTVPSQRSHNTGSCSRALVNHFKPLAFFIVKTCARSQNPTIDYLKICLFLLFDTIYFLWNIQELREEVINVRNSEEVNNMVQALNNFRHRADIRDLQEHIAKQSYLFI